MAKQPSRFLWGSKIEIWTGVSIQNEEIEPCPNKAISFLPVPFAQRETNKELMINNKQPKTNKKE